MTSPADDASRHDEPKTRDLAEPAPANHEVRPRLDINKPSLPGCTLDEAKRCADAGRKLIQSAGQKLIHPGRVIGEGYAESARGIKVRRRSA